ncbi:MAG: hypothetical protein CM15mP74_09050 [Halieaceae bacterium]|nr:MAG: hypothetical protein CM15mP74_09050 [Halieaceae bacterium]
MTPSQNASEGRRLPSGFWIPFDAAGTLPFEEGLKVERQAFETCMADPQSSACDTNFCRTPAAKIQG